MPQPDPQGTVTVIGSINIDHTITAPRFPKPGETILGGSIATSVGGKGANQTVAAARVGAKTTFLGRVGDDSGGAEAVDRLSADGVDVRVRRSSGAPTGTAWITVADADNQIIVIPGANHVWGELDDLDEHTGRADVILLQGEIPVDVIEHAAAATTGMLVLNTAPTFPISDELLRRVDVLVVNEHELADLTAHPVSSDADALAAQRLLRDRGARAIVTTRGPDDVIATIGERSLRTATPQADQVVDTTGAGDAFCGVLAARLAQGDTLEAAIRWGAAAGSLSVGIATAQASYPTLEQLLALSTDERHDR